MTIFQLRNMVWKGQGIGAHIFNGHLHRTSLEPFMVKAARNFCQQQSDLPRLPVPPLQQTLDKYLKSVKPLVSNDEFKVTSEIVSKFSASNGVGEKLQKALEERANKHENWLTDWWINTAYFDFRWPVIVWSSPGLVFPLQTFQGLDDQLRYASLAVSGALDYKIMIDENTIPVEMMGKQAVDMSQYFKIFGTCRIPGVTRDSLRYSGLEENPPKHIVVAHNSHFFKLDVFGKQGKPLNFAQIEAQLRNIIERSTHPAQSSVGILTTQNRNVWGQVYKKLLKDKKNKAAMEEIQRALFLVCIDGPIESSVNFQNDAALSCIHGNGSKFNSGNRWFDKTVQFVVGQKGEVGLAYEHSPAEGPPIANLMDHVVDYMESNKKDAQLPAVELTHPERLAFNVDNSIKEEIQLASKTLDSLVADLEMSCFVFDGFGKDFIKQSRLSPDSFIQMAIQLAFYRIHKEPGAHYESASTRKYLHGRTETIRSCSEESVKFAQTMLSDATNQEKVSALKTAIEGHKTFVKDAINGFGVDRHLLGLKLAALEQGMEVPTLFMDVSYIRSSHMRISSSQVPAKCEAFMCYGPLVPDGYGCCYNPRKETIVFGTSALNSSPETDSKVFRKALEDSLMDLKFVLEKEALKAKL